MQIISNYVGNRLSEPARRWDRKNTTYICNIYNITQIWLVQIYVKKQEKQFQERQGRCRIFIYQMFKMQNSSLLCKCKKCKIKVNFRYLVLPWQVYSFYNERLPYTYFTITIFYCWDNVWPILCVCGGGGGGGGLPFYRHCFIPFILRNYYDFHIFMSFTFEFYYCNLVSVEISLCKRTSRALGLIITLSRIKKCSKVLVQGFFSLAYVTWEL